jgi:histidinol-phosphate aminotransferase
MKALKPSQHNGATPLPQSNQGQLNVDLIVPDYIQSIEPYEPGKPIEELERDYGIQNSIKLASNENPLGPSPKAVLAIKSIMKDLHRYPDGGGYTLVDKLAAHLGVTPESIILGNGSDEVIGLLSRTLLTPGDQAIMPQPSFLMYEITVRSVGAEAIKVPLKTDMTIDLDAILGGITPRTRIIFLCNPNNPTGAVFTSSELNLFLKELPSGVTVVIDEAYIEFVRDPNCAQGLEYFKSGFPVVTLRTFSKIYGLAGLRIGYGLMPSRLANLLHRIRQPFNAGTLAQVGATAALDDKEYLNKTVTLVHSGLDFLFEAIGKLGLRCFPTQANFFLIDVQTDADTVFEGMLAEGIIVRSMRSYGYPRYIRINVGLPHENERFVAALAKILNLKGPN